MMHIKIGTYDELFANAWVVREVVFADNNGVTYDFTDEFDKTATHIVLFDDNKPIATARLIFKDNQWQIGRVAVLKEYQGKKLGAEVMNKLLEYAKKQEIKEVYLHSQCHAKGFYDKLGFVSYGDEYLEEGIPHISMVWKNND